MKLRCAYGFNIDVSDKEGTGRLVPCGPCEGLCICGVEGKGS